MPVTPTRATYAPDEPVRLVVASGPPGARLSVTRLGRTVVESDTPAGPGDAIVVDLGALPRGGYGADLLDAHGEVLASTAFDVLADPMERPRYGFVARYSDDVDPEALAAFAVRMHLNAIQHYDWAYRYTELVGPEEYADQLGNKVSMPVLRAMIAAYQRVGALALGYVALYAVPAAEWDDWAEIGLYRSTGEPYGFGNDFLNVVDPGAPRWRDTLVPAIARAREVGFDGFHLDQYGWPKLALRADGTITDLADTLPALVGSIAEAVPGARLIFNNVNGFPIERSAHAPQAALYTEVWPPRVDLRDLADLVALSRGLSDLSVIVAAYLSVFRDVGGDPARDAARLTMATIFSSGATLLLAGDAGRLLVHPYYVDSWVADPTTLAMLERWYTFLVRNGDLLLAPDGVDVTAAFAGEYNADVVIEAPEGVQVSIHPDPGCVWLRVMRSEYGFAVHLVNLTDQDETGWDTPKSPINTVNGLHLRMRQVRTAPVDVRWHDPDDPGRGRTLPGASDGIDQITELPALHAWALIHVEVGA